MTVPVLRPGRKLGKLRNFRNLRNFFLRFLNFGLWLQVKIENLEIRKLEIIFPRFARFPRFLSFSIQYFFIFHFFQYSTVGNSALYIYVMCVFSFTKNIYSEYYHVVIRYILDCNGMVYSVLTKSQRKYQISKFIIQVLPHINQYV